MAKGSLPALLRGGNVLLGCSLSLEVLAKELGSLPSSKAIEGTRVGYAIYHTHIPYLSWRPIMFSVPCHDIPNSQDGSKFSSHCCLVYWTLVMPEPLKTYWSFNVAASAPDKTSQ